MACLFSCYVLFHFLSAMYHVPSIGIVWWMAAWNELLLSQPSNGKYVLASNFLICVGLWHSEWWSSTALSIFRRVLYHILSQICLCFDWFGWIMQCMYIIYMVVSWNRGTPKSSNFTGIFLYKPTILGYPHFWKPPYMSSAFQTRSKWWSVGSAPFQEKKL